MSDFSCELIEVTEDLAGIKIPPTKAVRLNIKDDSGVEAGIVLPWSATGTPAEFFTAIYAGESPPFPKFYLSQLSMNKLLQCKP